MTIGLVLSGLFVSSVPSLTGSPVLAQSAAPTGPVRANGGSVETLAPGRVVVKFRSEASPDEVARVLRDEGLAERKRLGQDGPRVVQTEVGRERETIARLARHSAVQTAEADYIVKATGAAVPTDSLFSSQWDMLKINMPDAWGVTLGANVRVAVIDSGIQLTNPDLASQWTYASGHPASDHVFLTPPLSTGCSVPSQPSDDDGHGTHVAGTVAAASTLSGAPAIGMAGMAPAARILPLKALDCDGSGYLSDVADAIDFAVQNGVTVINMSLGGHTSDGCPSYLQSAITNAVSHGVFVAAAGGNDGNTSLVYPAGCAGVVGVAATDINDAHPSFSNQNSSVALSAPGVGILSTLNDGSYGLGSGTSMASPHVAACAALVRAAAPSMTGSAIRTLLQNTAVDLGPGGYDTTFGYGRLDCGAAMLAASGNTPNPTATPTRTPTPVVSQTPQATSTSSPTATQPTATFGGKGLAISQNSVGTRLTWQGGSAPGGYTVARLSGPALDVLSTFGPLPPSATSYVDASATGPNCYALFVLGTSPQGISDFVCDLVGYHTPTGSPQNFSLALNQSSSAVLNWSPPANGGQDSYVLVQLGGSGQTLPGNTTHASAAASGLTCYILGATSGGVLLGYTDILCGLPGFTNLNAGSLAATR